MYVKAIDGTQIIDIVSWDFDLVTPSHVCGTLYLTSAHICQVIS